MTDLKKEIKEIISDNEFIASPSMVIDEKKPFFWRFNKGWLESVSTELAGLFKKHRQAYCKGVIGEDEEKWWKDFDTQSKTTREIHSRKTVYARNQLRAEQRGRNEK